MKFRRFSANFHDGQLASFRLGPRRELTLEIALDPVWNKDRPRAQSVRFGGIENFDEVSSYFRALPPPRTAGGYIAEIIGVAYSGDGPNWVIVDIAGQGHIFIKSQHAFEL